MEMGSTNVRLSPIDEITDITTEIRISKIVKIGRWRSDISIMIARLLNGD